jgi:hypothetical protein
MKAIITSFDSGSYYLPRQVLYFYKGEELVDTIVVNERTLEVTTIPIDTATYQMYDIKGPITYPVTFREVIPWVGLGVALIILGYLIYRMIRNRRENRSLLGKPAVQEPAHIIALRSLEEIRGKKLWQNNMRVNHCLSPFSSSLSSNTNRRLYSYSHNVPIAAVNLHNPIKKESHTPSSILQSAAIQHRPPYGCRFRPTPGY